MKIAVFSFLFCFVVGFSQTQTDSIPYYQNILLNPEKEGDLTKAYLFFENQIENNRKKRDTINLIRNLHVLAIAQINLGLFYESEQSAIEALQWIENNKSNIKQKTSNSVGLYNLLGNLYKKRHYYDKALNYYNKAIRVAQKTDSINLLNNIALVYKEQANYPKAISFLSKALDLTEKNPHNITYNRVLDNLGFVKTKLQDKEGLSFLLKALNNRKQNKDLIGLFSSYRHLFYYYKDHHKNQIAKAYADSSYAIAKKLKSNSFLKEALSFYLLLNENKKINEYKTVTDSIEKEQKFKQNKFAALKYDINKEKQVALTYKLNLERQKKIKTIILSIGFFILLLLSLIFYILKGKHRREKIKEIYKTEQEIAKKVHDEIANEVYGVMVQLQHDETPKEKLLDNLERVYNKTRNISQKTSTIDTNDFKNELQALFASFRTNNTKIITKNFETVNWKNISNLKKQAIYRILQELLTNMHKHSQATISVISFDQKNKKITITYTDNGVGWNNKKGKGLANVENRIKYLKGVIKFEKATSKKDAASKKGFKVIFTV